MANTARIEVKINGKLQQVYEIEIKTSKSDNTVGKSRLSKWLKLVTSDILNKVTLDSIVKEK